MSNAHRGLVADFSFVGVNQAYPWTSLTVSPAISCCNVGDLHPLPFSVRTGYVHVCTPTES